MDYDACICDGDGDNDDEDVYGVYDVDDVSAPVRRHLYAAVEL